MSFVSQSIGNIGFDPRPREGATRRSGRSYPSCRGFDPRPREGATAPGFGEPNLRPGPSLRERSANLHSAAVVGRRRRGRGVRNPKSRNAFGRSRTPRGFRARLGFAEIVERPGGPVPAGGLATGRQWFGIGSAVVQQWFGSGSRRRRSRSDEGTQTSSASGWERIGGDSALGGARPTAASIQRRQLCVAR